MAAELVVKTTRRKGGVERNQGKNQRRLSRRVPAQEGKLRKDRKGLVWTKKRGNGPKREGAFGITKEKTNIIWSSRDLVMLGGGVCMN